MPLELCERVALNYQDWRGFTDGRFGYGSMLNGFLGAIPDGVAMHEKASTSIHMGVPFSCKGFYDGAHKVLFTMWETDELPARFVAWCDYYDQVLVPCEHNVELFSRYHRNVKHVPLGVDGNAWHPVQRPENPVFRIHAGGSLWGRKGLDLVVAACRLLRFDHELHIKLAPHARDNPPLDTMPEVKFHREWMSQDDQLRFFNQADLWVCPSRGEGFGLIPLQAIACAVPTILTATSGQAQFAHFATGVVGHRKVAAGDTGRWDEADLEELAAKITDHYENLSSVRATAAKNAPLAAKAFSWQEASRKLVATVPEGRLLSTNRFVDAAVKTRFEVNRTVESSINNKQYLFHPGRDYVEDENVFHVLWNAGYIVKEPQ